MGSMLCNAWLATDCMTSCDFLVRLLSPRPVVSWQVRLGQRLQVWRMAGGGLQLKFLDPEPATEPSNSSSSGAGGSKQHSTGSKRARRQ